jgi:hypothetical protein
MIIRTVHPKTVNVISAARDASRIPVKIRIVRQLFENLKPTPRR